MCSKQYNVFSSKKNNIVLETKWFILLGFENCALFSSPVAKELYRNYCKPRNISVHSIECFSRCRHIGDLLNPVNHISKLYK